MIVTLAGHVDHGKTALVRALTGVDTDRLEAEKRRGLTIELGFAYGSYDGQRIGFVDVPGHHRFIGNMIAGVSSQQFALLVVAADEGPMPQTKEHLEILQTIGIERGILAMMRSDLADEDRRAASQTATERLLAGTFLENAKPIWCSTKTGEGLQELRSALSVGARSSVRRGDRASLDERYFRLSVDRAFNLTGTGLVVTGAVHSGSIHQGDEVVTSRHGRAARVRSIRVSDEPAECAVSGERAALNLTGLELDDLGRGDWLVAPAANRSTKRISLELRATTRLRKWTHIHLHHGAGHTRGRLALLDVDRLDAGQACIADCLLERPIIAKWGDRMLIRDAGAMRTLGGGPVIDSCIAERNGRTKPAQRSALLQALRHDNLGESLLRALQHTPLISLADYASVRNVSEESVLKQPEMRDVICIGKDSKKELLLQSYLVDAEHAIVKLVNEWHTANAKSHGMAMEALRTTSNLPQRVLRHVLTGLLASGRLAIRAGEVLIPGFKPELAAGESALLDALEASEMAAPTLGDLAKLMSMDMATLARTAKRLEATKEIVFLNSRRIMQTRKLQECVRLAESLDCAEGFGVGEFRDASGQGRNSSIDMLEYLDRTGFTRRSGDRRHLIRGG